MLRKLTKTEREAHLDKELEKDVEPRAQPEKDEEKALAQKTIEMDVDKNVAPESEANESSQQPPIKEEREPTAEGEKVISCNAIQRYAKYNAEGAECPTFNLARHKEKLAFFGKSPYREAKTSVDGRF